MKPTWAQKLVQAIVGLKWRVSFKVMPAHFTKLSFRTDSRLPTDTELGQAIARKV